MKLGSLLSATRIAITILATLAIAFVLVAPVNSSFTTVRCPDGTGCSHRRVRSIATTTLNIYFGKGWWSTLNRYTVTLGVVLTIVLGLAIYQALAPKSARA